MHSDVVKAYGESKTGSTRIRLNLALCDADMMETKRAASGLLAIVCGSSESFCRHLFAEQRFIPIMCALLDPNVLEELHLRAIAIVTQMAVLQDLCKQIKGQKELVQALINLGRQTKVDAIQASLVQLQSILSQ